MDCIIQLGRKIAIIIITLLCYLINNAVAMTDTERQSINKQLDQLQQQVDRLDDQVKNNAISDKKPSALVTTSSVIPKLLSSSGATYSREITLLKGIASDEVKPNSFSVGTKIKEIVNYYSDQNDGSGNYSSESSLSTKADVAFLTRVTPWLSGFYRIEGKTNSLSVEAKERYFIVNNGEVPYYAIVGAKYVDFGNFQRFSADFDPLNRVFWISDNVSQIELGYYSSGLNVQLTVFNGDDDTNTNTNQISNNAATAFYQFSPFEGTSVYLGGAYLNAMQETDKLENSTTVILTDGTRTAAYDVFIGGNVNFDKTNSLSFGGEYSQSIQMDNDRMTNAWLAGSIFQTKIMDKKVKFYANYSGLNALNGHRNQYSIGADVKLYGLKIGLDYALLTASEERNDNMLTMLVEYKF